jgi:hypothetical protein
MNSRRIRTAGTAGSRRKRENRINSDKHRIDTDAHTDKALKDAAILDVSKFTPKRYLKEVSSDYVIIGSRILNSNIKLNRYVTLNSEMCWALGFFMAEGAKCDYMIGVSNCESRLIENFRNILEKYLFISKPHWQFFIRSSDIKKSEEIWSRRYPGSKIFFYKNDKTNADNIEIRFNNRPLAYTFNLFTNRAAKIAVMHPHLAVSFLKGYAIGDGSVIRRNGYLYGISITVKNVYYKNLLLRAIKIVYRKSASVRLSKGSFEISLTGVELMSKMILDGWFNEVPRQWNKLISSFILKEYTRSHIRYWKALQGKALCVLEVAATTNRSHWSVRDAMKKDAGLNLINIKRKRIPNLAGPHHVYFELTDKGESLLNSLLEVKGYEKT